MSEKAIGLIETRGFLATVESLDASLKAAQVELLSRTFTTGGLVCLAVTGEVAAVKAAVDAGSDAARRFNGLVGNHVIPRPSDDVVTMIKNSGKGKRKGQPGNMRSGKKQGNNEFSNSGEKKGQLILQLKEILEGTSVYSIISGDKALEEYKVTELRKILRNLDLEGITGRAISKMKKQQILEVIYRHFGIDPDDN